MEYSHWPENDHKKAIGELIEGREFANQLQFLLQNQKPLGDHELATANFFATKILRSFTNALSIMNSGESTGDFCQSPMTTQASSPYSDDRKSEDSGNKRKIPALKDRRVGYKRRKTSNTRVKITPTPIEDGHAWRKYGQKEILKAKYPRNYFRCTHKNDQGCQATKQVQKTDDDPPMYQTTYMGHHTCRDPLKPPQLILDSPPTPPPTSSNNLLDFQSNLTKQDYHPLISPFSSIKLEFKNDHDHLRTDTHSSSDQYILSQNLTTFESSGPTTKLASSSGSDHGDVISSVYSCTTSSQSLDLDLTLDFDDMFRFDEGLFQDH